MSKIIIVKNTTLSDISVAGTTIFANDQHTINFSRLPVWREDPNVETLINVGDLVINDGTLDLDPFVGLTYLLSDSPPNIIYVSPTGSDTDGDGGITNPFRTIKYALSTISGSGPSNRFQITVSPATYIEDNPLIVPTYVELLSSGGITSAKIEALNTTVNLIEVSGITAIKGFNLSGVSGGALIHQDDVNGSCSISDITLGESNHGISCSGGNISFTTVRVDFGTTIGQAIHVDSGGTVGGQSFGLTGNSTTVAKVFHADGGNLNITNFLIDSSSVTDGLHIENSGVGRITDGAFENVDNAIHLATSADLDIASIDIIDTISFDFLIEDITPVLSIIGSQFRRDKISIPPEYNNITGFYLNQEPIVGGLRVFGDVVAGEPEIGTSLSIGRGDPYTRGMVVLTTDNTATNTTDGGNITDVTTEAKSYINSTFSFQGAGANNTILFGSDIDEAGDKIKFWGVKLKQTTAAVENVKKSFIFERWDGSTWAEFGFMTTFIPEAYVYSKEAFIRSNQTEDLFFGLDDDSTWVKKTINGKNLYWVRIRITNNLITAPVFEQAKLIPSHIQTNNKGIIILHGSARFRKTILSSGNIFGESGAVTFSNPLIGATGGWNHSMKNNQLNEINDSLYIQFVLPRGIDTSFPLEVFVYYQDTSGTASTDGTLRISALLMEVVGVLAADETGGIVPVARTLSDVTPITTDDAQIIDKSTSLGDANIITAARNIVVDISDSYEGDMIALKIEYLNDGDTDKNIIIWGVEIAAVSWVLGDRI